MTVKISLEHPILQTRQGSYAEDRTYNEIANLMRDVRKQFQVLAEAVNFIYAGIQLPSYAVADVPTASEWAQRLIYVSDETGGAIPAFSDGTNWRRVTDRAIIS